MSRDAPTRATVLWTRFVLLLALGLLLFVLLPPAHAEDWSKRDKYIGAAALTLHIADWAQTRYIARNPERYYEQNPILGEHPSIGEVNRFFILSGIATYLIADWLSGDGRTVFLTGITIIKTGAVIHNYSIGIRMEF